MRAPATSRPGTETTVAVASPVTPRICTGEPALMSMPARAMAAGVISVRSAPVSTSRRSGTPLMAASTTSGPPEYGMTAPLGTAGVAGTIGPGVGEPTSTALSRNVEGMLAASVV
ncbi:MAG: hypothetical protein DMD78_15660 [Candidatus Rokuibacteriota bacterium]|nr:MAG: hypothetical protein DMD78_15660 [Candidatus Rokubacteria bacterium]